MSDVLIRAEGLTKLFGRHPAVVDLDMDVLRGEVLGYLGPNGAGKTTTIRMFMDFIRPSRGRVSLFGLDARRGSLEIRRRIGYLPGELALYGKMTGAEILRYAGHLRGQVDWGFVEGLADRIKCPISQSVRSLSHGNKQKIGLLLAFMHRPELLILDEPTLGLDPLIQQEFCDIIAETRAEGRTVFLSSHNLTELERICDRVAMIRDGRLIAIEDMAALKSQTICRLEIHFAGPAPREAFTNLAGVRELSIRDNVLRCTVLGSVDQVIKTAARFDVLNIVSHEPSLEEAFLAYYSQEGGNAG